ncbi:hypothetical protein HK103_003607 [Boothiomyces macroporosus]|uniref:Ammonium transporter n=1 Tax=Boothiomyces macroporosus TaxID=261099 RepID=A0AAD5Y6B4_9FUNG|nr:hypothetical protein HK103_003607 [Boothiomyces macroporosus]
MSQSDSALNASMLMPNALTSNPTDASATPFVENGYPSTGFLVVCSALVMIMTPAVGLLYSGLSRSKNALTILMISCLCYAVVTVQWLLFGFSLTFSETGSTFIGNFALAGMDSVMDQALPLTAPTVPSIAYALYQLQFATVTLAIVFGGVTERVRLLPSILFMFVWTTLIYDPVAYWTWGARGWIKNLSCLPSAADLSQTPCQIGGLDFAGGGPVHMSSGAAALAFCIFLGRRKGAEEFKPHNMTNVFIGTALIWMGWFGFNAGSSTDATARAALAGMATTIAASSGALAWTLLDYARSGKFSGLAFCSGALAGLVGITPAAGFVPGWAALIIGIVTAVLCNFSIRLKEILGYDDSLDAFGLHGVGGLVGSILTGLFAAKKVVALDNASIPGGAFMDGQWKLLGYNIAGSVSILGYSFVGTFIILFIINMIPGLKFRSSDNEELVGGDLAEMGEVAYELVPSNNEAPSLLDMKKDSDFTVDAF